ncbi:hypothetical protein AALP_AA8G189300 [Arabis alpina]|uniref:Uncharacterized protein n=1 Tax=Arabis alpina TaxID=50452 RepID=A0A087G7Z4_ARAAL|nr:hypothetical protein AALP_AA8G189300 [Arabis alpina]
MGRPSLNLDVYVVDAVPVHSVSPTIAVDPTLITSRIEKAKGKRSAVEGSRRGVDGDVVTRKVVQLKKGPDVLKKRSRDETAGCSGAAGKRARGEKRERGVDKATLVDAADEVGLAGVETVDEETIAEKTFETKGTLVGHKTIRLPPTDDLIDKPVYTGFGSHMVTRAFDELDVLEVTEEDFRYVSTISMTSRDVVSMSIDTALRGDQFGIRDSWELVESRALAGRKVEDDAESRSPHARIFLGTVAAVVDQGVGRSPHDSDPASQPPRGIDCVET